MQSNATQPGNVGAFAGSRPLSANDQLLALGRDLDQLMPEVARLHRLQQDRIRTAHTRFAQDHPGRLVKSDRSPDYWRLVEQYEAEAGAFNADCDYEGAAKAQDVIAARIGQLQATTLEGMRVKLMTALLTYSSAPDDEAVCDLLLDLASMTKVGDGRPWLARDLRTLEDSRAEQRMAAAKVRSA